MKGITVTVCLICLTLSVTSMAFAHKIRIFAYGEADTIHGETGFSGGRQPKNVEIRVVNAEDNALLLTTTTDEQGKFSFPIPGQASEKQLNLRIIVDGGDGHSNSWLLEAADYLPEAQSTATESTTVFETKPTLKRPQPSSTCQSLDPEELRAIIDESVARQLGPVNHMLAKLSERRLSLQDILGGIGYIIGLAGLAAYMQSKKRR